MKALLKGILKKILFETDSPTAFPAVRIPVNQVQERFILKSHSARLDVSDKHCIVCHSPFCIMVWMTPEHRKKINVDQCEAEVMTGERLDARIRLTVHQRIPEGGNELIVFRAIDAENFQLNKLRQTLIRRYFKNKNSVLEDKFYAAAYSFPRRVIAVSFRDGDYYNIFPMDFQCFVQEKNLYILGLRTTNVTLERIIANKRVVIGDTNEADIKTLYALGSHHSAAPPPMASLPFQVIDSDVFKFPVPAFSAGYKEIELTADIKIGTHMMLIGKVVNTKEMRPWNYSMYHTHFFQSVQSDYPTTR